MSRVNREKDNSCPDEVPRGLYWGLLWESFLGFKLGGGGGGVLYSEELTFRNFTRYKLILKNSQYIFWKATINQ